MPDGSNRGAGADFFVKDALRAGDYRWSVELKVWWLEMMAKTVTAEEFWLAGEVYGPEHRAR